MDSDTPPPEPSPSVWRWVLAFLLVGAAWGLTTPFMRRAAVKRNEAPQPERPVLADSSGSGIRRKAWGVIYAVVDLLKNPAYAVPLLLNITGSVWFFILVGQAELSLTVPITNSLAFLFTVLGEWYAEGKVISRDTWIGMTFVLGGVALCVQSKAR
ncbi:integral membrane protein [Teratosphaeria destructans]|uniref:Integral membrane protein n=1 Tax=Teratosphaeria destructans TaxID=418781 RepID=A0A9W7SVG0_9PEZI|nr:integral membrane protein [Teratosphaeria destructans]